MGRTDDAVVYSLRLLASEKAAWEQAAEADYRNMTLWIRYACSLAIDSPPQVPAMTPVEGDSMVMVSPRAKPAELAAWKTAAASLEQEISTWIRNACNAAVAAAKQKPGKV
jgi:hypothetical protein